MLKVALVGRTNVGKSTLFNRLTRSRDALVADEAGLTRDRHYGYAENEGQQWLIIDTGGLVDGTQSADIVITKQIAMQTEWAIAEANLVCFVADAREGLTSVEETAVQQLRHANKQFWLVINKIDGGDEHAIAAEFASLGISSCFQISALQGRGVDILRDAFMQQAVDLPDEFATHKTNLDDGVRVTFLGRPNVGKSTLLNRLLDEERVLTSATPGTTRDCIEVPFVFNGTNFILVDTAGVRRRRKIDERVEKFSVLKALESVMRSDVVVLVCDAGDGVTSQDAALIGQVISAGRALVVAANKSDLIVDSGIRYKFERSRDLGLGFLHGIETLELSALQNRGIKRLMHSVQRAFDSARVHVATPKCTKLLNIAVERNQPPLVSGKRAKLRYAHQGGTCPPRFIVHGSRVDELPPSYRRYLENFFREKLKLIGTPVVFEFRRASNRFVE